MRDAWIVKACDGPNWSIHFEPKIDHAANAGFSNALLEPIKEKYPELSYANLFQMNFAVVI